MSTSFDTWRHLALDFPHGLLWALPWFKGLLEFPLDLSRPITADLPLIGPQVPHAVSLRVLFDQQLHKFLGG
jgi:hypothetical protein